MFVLETDLLSLRKMYIINITRDYINISFKTCFKISQMKKKYICLLQIQ